MKCFKSFFDKKISLGSALERGVTIFISLIYLGIIYLFLKTGLDADFSLMTYGEKYIFFMVLVIFLIVMLDFISNMWDTAPTKKDIKQIVEEALKKKGSKK